jgi:flavorubredoxin
MRWVEDGDSFVAGDRTLAAVRPPLFDSPTTRGLFDAKTGVYWASDCFGVPVTGPVENVAEIPHEQWQMGVGMFSTLLSPWYAIADPAKFGKTVEKVASLDPSIVATAHGPIVTGANVSELFDITRNVPGMPPFEAPGQAMLDAMLKEMMAEPQAA